MLRYGSPSLGVSVKFSLRTLTGIKLDWELSCGIELLRSFIEQVMLFLNPSKNQRPAELGTLKMNALGIGRNKTAGSIQV